MIYDKIIYFDGDSKKEESERSKLESVLDGTGVCKGQLTFKHFKKFREEVDQESFPPSSQGKPKYVVWRKRKSGSKSGSKRFTSCGLFQDHWRRKSDKDLASSIVHSSDHFAPSDNLWTSANIIKH